MTKQFIKIGKAAALLGVTIDRDLNAAINIAKYAASSAVSACGEESAGVEQST